MTFKIRDWESRGDEENDARALTALWRRHMEHWGAVEPTKNQRSWTSTTIWTNICCTSSAVLAPRTKTTWWSSCRSCWLTATSTKRPPHSSWTWTIGNPSSRRRCLVTVYATHAAYNLASPCLLWLLPSSPSYFARGFVCSKSFFFFLFLFNLRIFVPN